MLVEINNLREVARRCIAGEPMDDELSRWFGTSLQDFLERRFDTIEDALGLRAPQGGVPWWMEIAIRTRDAALRELADSFHAERSVSGRAQEIRGFRLLHRGYEGAFQDVQHVGGGFHQYCALADQVVAAARPRVER